MASTVLVEYEEGRAVARPTKAAAVTAGLTRKADARLLLPPTAAALMIREWDLDVLEEQTSAEHDRILAMRPPPGADLSRANPRGDTQ
jgi:hypothetical protein